MCSQKYTLQKLQFFLIIICFSLLFIGAEHLFVLHRFCMSSCVHFMLIIFSNFCRIIVFFLFFRSSLLFVIMYPHLIYPNLPAVHLLIVSIVWMIRLYKFHSLVDQFMQKKDFLFRERGNREARKGRELEVCVLLFPVFSFWKNHQESIPMK